MRATPVAGDPAGDAAADHAGQGEVDETCDQSAESEVPALDPALVADGPDDRADQRGKDDERPECGQRTGERGRHVEPRPARTDDLGTVIRAVHVRVVSTSAVTVRPDYSDEQRTVPLVDERTSDNSPLSRAAEAWCAGTSTGCKRLGSLRGMADIKTFQPLIGRWSQVVDAPRHVEEKIAGDMTLEWLRDEKVILQRTMVQHPMFPEGVVLITAAEASAEGEFTAYYFDSRAVSRVLQMSFEDGTWRWWRHATDPDDFDQRFEGRLSEDGKSINSSCYLVEDGEWVHDFDVIYVRA